MMNVEQLQKYLPRYGACLATIAYAKQQIVLEDTASSCSYRKRSLRYRLLDKLRATGNIKKISEEQHFRLVTEIKKKILRKKTYAKKNEAQYILNIQILVKICH